MAPSNKLGSILLETGKINEQQLEQAIEKQKGTRKLLGDVLVELQFVRPQDIARCLARQLDIPYFELGDDFRLEPEEVKLIPESVSRRFCLIPVKREDGPTLTVVMRDPLDIQALDTVRSLTNLEIRKAVGTEERIRAVIDRFYREDAHIERNLQDLVDLETEEIEIDGDAATDTDQLRVQANDAPVVRFVNLLLMQAVRDRASDIHFEPGERAVAVRLRIDGVLREVTPPPKSLYQAIVTRIKILSEMDIAERRLPLDGRFKFKAYGRIIDVRVSSLPEVHGEKLVLRLLDREALLVDMRSIGFEDDMLTQFQRILHMPHGIILLTGPTGSGKTTTLYSALSYIQSPEKNIQTVEDPVEYQIPGINQMQIKPAINLDFAHALRSILRQDPDIIMIGEIRDLETARIAMRASLTGHLVLSTLHTNDAPSAVWRLKDIGVESYLIGATVELVISQRLVRVICDDCREEYTPPSDLFRVVRAVCPDADQWRYVRGAGCRKCGKSGFRGRTALIEFMEMSDPLREIILAGAGETALRNKAAELGMQPLHVDGFAKVKNGVTTLDEVMNVCPILEHA